MIETDSTYKHIHVIPFKDLVLWDVKRMLRKSISTNFPVVTLGSVITEQSHREKIFEKPNEDFKILGVNNKVGLFDAYIEKGKNINQSYKKVEQGWLAYNPYRINVGSIGVKLPQHTYEYISPAYVVFSCKSELNPEFLFLIFKSNTFNSIIRQNTIGAVRQILSFETLSSLQIPLPTLTIQKKLVVEYHNEIKLSKKLTVQGNRFEKEIKSYFFSQLNIQSNSFQNNYSKGKIFEFRFKDLVKWSLSKMMQEQSISFDNSKFERIEIKKLLKSFDGGKTPSTLRTDYWNGKINWVSPKDFNGLEISSSEDKITEKAVKDTSMKVFDGGIILGVFRSGILRHSFPVAITTIPVTINQDLKAMEVNQDIVEAKFLLYYLHLMQEFVLEKCSKVGVTVESINTEEFLTLPVVVPPKEKQLQIIKQIEDLQLKVNTLKTQSRYVKEEATRTFERTIFNTK